MRKFYTAVVNHPKTILTFFAAVMIVCAVLQNLVGVNYDMNDYLPEDSPSTVALNRMEEEFSGGIPNARVMVRDVTVPEALEYKERLGAVDGVTDVLWLDDAVDIRVPLAVLDADTVETYYKDNTALFTVTIAEESRIPATEEIRAIIGEENAMSGTAVSTAVATTSTVSQIQKIVVIAILFAIFVLAVTTTAWLEPIVILLGLGVAVIINSGTNLIFGEISFVTNAAGSILQLAVSLDYSVFLLHRYEECMETNRDSRKAMVDALCISTSSILSSGVTTVIGFLALVFMSFRIGPDLGLALAKGVAISLISVFVFFPNLVLVSRKWVNKTRHRFLLPDFHGFGRVVSYAMLPVMVLFFLVMVPCHEASTQNNFYYGSSHIFGPETQLGADVESIEAVYGKSDTYVLMVPRGDFVTEQALSGELHTLPQVTSIISYVDTVGRTIPMEYVPEEALEQLLSDDYSRMVLSIDADYEGPETFQLVQKIREIAQSYYPDTYYLAGEGVSTYDLMDTITADMGKVNGIAIGAVFVVLLLTMKSLVLPVLLVLSIETAIWINLAIPYFANDYIFFIAYLIISSIQLGATVDYAILFTDRYRENRTYRGIEDKRQAAVETISSTAVSILTSGSVLTVVGFLLGGFSTHGILSQLGLFLGKGTLLSMTIVFFVLPGLLYTFDRFVLPREAKKKLKPKKEAEAR
ncbi:MAG: RND family transporter [Candidatus Onthomonas sp.]